MEIDTQRFRLYQPNLKSWENSRDLNEIIRFLNERGDDLLRHGPIPEPNEVHGNYLSDPTRTRVSLIRDLDANPACIVAVAMLKFSYDWRNGVGDVECVLVDEAFRFLGLGRGLMEHLIAQAREVFPKIHFVRLISEPDRVDARTLYLKIGFQLVEGSDRHFELVL